MAAPDLARAPIEENTSIMPGVTSAESTAVNSGENSARPQSEPPISEIRSDSTFMWDSSVNNGFALRSMSYEDLRMAFKMAANNRAEISAAGGGPKGTGADAPPGDLMEAVAATVVQCCVRRLLARQLVKKMKKKKDDDYQTAAHGELDNIAATQIQQMFRAKHARKTVEDARTQDGNSELRQMGIAASAAKKPKETADGKAVAEDGGPEYGGGMLMQTEAAKLIQSNFRKHRVQQKVSDQWGTNRLQSFAVESFVVSAENNQPQEGELDAETEHVSVGPRSRLSEVRANRASADPAVSYLGWGTSKGQALSAVFEDAMNATVDKSRVPDGQSLWGIRALHAVSMRVQGEFFMPRLQVSRWVEGPLGAVAPLTNEASK